MVTADQTNIVCKLIPSSASMARQEDSSPKEAEALHVNPRPSRIVTIHVELVHVPLDQRLVLGRRTECVIPRSLQGAVPGKFRGTARISRQSLHIGIFFS